MAFTPAPAASAGQDADEDEAESEIENGFASPDLTKSIEVLNANFTPLGGRGVEMSCLNCILITPKCFR